MSSNERDQLNQIEDALTSAIRGLGRVNIIISGKTGVGKSTLINTVFRGKLAKTGSGQPVTQHIEEITKDGVPLCIIDTKGLEIQAYKTIIDGLEEEISERSANHDESKHIHVAWLCILEDGRRVEKAEQDLCEMFNKNKIPVVVAITKARSDKGFRDEVKKALPTAKAVISVRALAEEIDDDGEILLLKEKGVNDLIKETSKLVPDAVRRAYTNALNSKHAATLKLRIEQAEREVNVAAGLAAAASAVPIPFSDAFALVPIQVGMLAKISMTFGMEATAAALSTLVTSTLGASAATFIGRTLVTGLLKMTGIGSIAGGAIAATTAAAITKALGKSYIYVLTDFIEKNPGKEFDVDLISNELKKKISIM